MLMFPKFYPTVADAGQRSWSWLTQNGADGRIDRVLQCFMFSLVNTETPLCVTAAVCDGLVLIAPPGVNLN